MPADPGFGLSPGGVVAVPLQAVPQLLEQVDAGERLPPLVNVGLSDWESFALLRQREGHDRQIGLIVISWLGFLLCLLRFGRLRRRLRTRIFIFWSRNRIRIRRRNRGIAPSIIWQCLAHAASIAPSIIWHCFCVFIGTPPGLGRSFCLLRSLFCERGKAVVVLPIMHKQPFFCSI